MPMTDHVLHDILSCNSRTDKDEIIEEIQKLKGEVQELKKEQKKSFFLQSMSEEEKRIFNQVAGNMVQYE